MKLTKEDLERVKNFMEAQIRDSKITQFTSEAIMKAVEKAISELPKEENHAVK